MKSLFQASAKLKQDCIENNVNVEASYRLDVEPLSGLEKGAVQMVSTDRAKVFFDELTRQQIYRSVTLKKVQEPVNSGKPKSRGGSPRGWGPTGLERGEVQGVNRRPNMATG